MANPYLRFMNGDMPFWDFVSEMGGQEYAQQYGGHGDEHGGRRGGRHDRRHRGPPGPPGPHGPPPPPGFDPHGPPPPSFPFGGFGGFGSWSPFDGPAPEGPWGHGPGHHDFPHRPHPRHRHGGRHGPPHDGPAPPEPPRSGDEDMDTPPATPHARTGDDAATLMSDDTITLQDNEKNEKDKDVDFPDPDISTPDGDDKGRDSNKDKDDGSGSDSDSDHRRRRGCPWGRRRGPHGHGPHGPGAHWGGPRRGRGGFGGWPGRQHPQFPYGHGGPWARHGPHPPFGGPGRHGPPHHRRGPSGEDDNPFNGGSGFDDLMRAFAADPRLSGIGDMIGNVLRATGAALNPDAARNGATREQSGDNANDNNPDVDFRPSADIYDTTDAFIVHVVVPGAEKENVSVSWDGNTQELRVAGFVAREGDEETLQALALAERDVGVFERSLKLGTDKVEEDGIAAKMTNGILEITVPKKKEEETWTEVRSVDIL